MGEDWPTEIVDAAAEKAAASDRTRIELCDLLEGIGSSKRMTGNELAGAAQRLMKTLEQDEPE